MKPNIIHSIVVCLAAFALPFIVACSSQEESLPDTVTEAALYLNVSTLEQSRSGETANLPDNEQMHSVRVVVLHADGSVEHNRHYSLEGAQAQKYIILKVSPNEKKQIFLFANEESVSVVEGVTGGEQTLTGFFSSYTEKSEGFETAVNGLYFTPDYSGGKPIPMSSMYEIDFTEGRFEGTFYVVRVATTFTVNFKNWRDEEVTVKSFTLAKHADKNFLMAHVRNTDQNTELFDGETWIKWLKKVSDASSENDSYETTEATGWLKDYELPATADKAKTYTNGEVSVGKPTVDMGSPDRSKPGVAKNVPVFYLPESMNLKAGATDGEQEYKMTINIKEGEEEAKVKSFSFTLPNLKALFRNTHVIVNITLLNDMEIVVDVIPYSEVKLDPVFGL